MWSVGISTLSAISLWDRRFRVFQKEWGGRVHPPAISVLRVMGLANPKWLIEIDAIAVVSE